MTSCSVRSPSSSPSVSSSPSEMVNCGHNSCPLGCAGVGRCFSAASDAVALSSSSFSSLDLSSRSVIFSNPPLAGLLELASSPPGGAVGSPAVTSLVVGTAMHVRTHARTSALARQGREAGGGEGMAPALSSVLLLSDPKMLWIFFSFFMGYRFDFYFNLECF